MPFQRGSRRTDDRYHVGMKPTFKPVQGFTWIELMLSVAVLAGLALLAIPALQETTLKKQVKEAMSTADIARKGVQDAYAATGDMPQNNKQAGVPDPEKIIGSLVRQVKVQDGAVTLTFGNNVSKVLENKKLTLRPAVVPKEPLVAVAWLCHALPVPKGMEAQGGDETDVPDKYLPLECRDTSSKK
jgi:type IV pilus assembly protein PilA